MLGDKDAKVGYVMMIQYSPIFLFDSDIKLFEDFIICIFFWGKSFDPFQSLKTLNCEMPSFDYLFFKVENEHERF